MQENNLSFNDFEIDSSILDGISDLGFLTPTPIQQKTLPLTLKGYDVMGVAQTGTGKTAAFLISLLQYLMVNPIHPKAKGPWAIVLAPTRELAIQIKKDLNQLGAYTGLNSLAIYGGTNIERQKELFAAAPIDIIIGTPGRIIDLYKQKVFRLRNIEVCVLDEADRMFDLGFIDDVRYLLRQMPPADERLNLLFSATMARKVQELAYEHFNAPQEISIESEKPTAENVEQVLYHTAKYEKTPLLLGLFELEKPQRSIIFLNTKRDLDRLSLVLNANGYPNLAISGDIVQKRREQIIADFQAGKTNILLATDIAARGLHIPDITHIFNYDLPQTAEDYVHRIGRTARAGASGKAISFACEEYVYSLPEIEHYIGSKIQVEPIDDELLADVVPLSEAELNSLKANGENGNSNGYNNGNSHSYNNLNNNSDDYYRPSERNNNFRNNNGKRRFNRFILKNGNRRQG